MPLKDIYDQYPEILDILLLDRTKSTKKHEKNIIFANNNYENFNPKKYKAIHPITREIFNTNIGEKIIPRSHKSKETQKERTRCKAEVFTPTWIIKQQNDEAEKDYVNDPLEIYVKIKWLEVACGEAPYIATRYDMITGEQLPLNERESFLDRKLKRINGEVNDKLEWQHLVELAYKSCYGFEWSGDSLLLARENLLYTYCDYYQAKWNTKPAFEYFKKIAIIISYNIFQMDGLTKTIPLSETKTRTKGKQMTLFGEILETDKWEVKPGIRVKIMNWETNKMEYIDKEE